MKEILENLLPLSSSVGGTIKDAKGNNILSSVGTTEIRKQAEIAQEIVSIVNRYIPEQNNNMVIFKTKEAEILHLKEVLAKKEEQIDYLINRLDNLKVPDPEVIAQANEMELKPEGTTKAFRIKEALANTELHHIGNYPWQYCKDGKLPVINYKANSVEVLIIDNNDNLGTAKFDYEFGWQPEALSRNIHNMGNIFGVKAWAYINKPTHEE